MNIKTYLLLKLCKLLVIVLIFSCASSTVPAQTKYTPTKNNLASRRWFQDAKFGLFIHWGVYSVLEDGEWVMQVKKLPISEYEKLPARFNPTEFNAAEWVAIAKAAGMKYITITSKHHDGFAMFDSKASDWDIVDRTPYKKDVLKMLADECHKQGIKLFFYHSQLDWHHPDYFPRGQTGQYTGRVDKGEWYKYLDYMDAQLAELLTGYGKIGGIWFDGMWDKPQADWRLEKTYKLIHDLQPDALVGSNHHKAPFAGEDFQMFEKDLPGKNTAGFNTAEIGALPLETCETMNGSWGYNANDKKFKSPRDLIHYLVRAAGFNANFLLNVGPMPNGKIQPEFVATLKEIGAWLRANGETIYGTRGGAITPQDWGAVTTKGNKIFIHLLNLKTDTLTLSLTEKIKSARYRKDRSQVAFEQTQNAVVLKNLKMIDADDTIIVLEK
ncbi:MAG: alpha-L-fucosidase [Acidobacteriota bacterium]